MAWAIRLPFCSVPAMTTIPGTWFRGIFTRYDKLDSSFLAFVHIAAIAILLK